MLLWALGPNPYAYYTILRWVVCGITAYGAFQAAEIKKNEWVWIFGFIALLFNPIIPVHLTREIWSVIDIACAITLISSIFLFKEKK